MGQCTGCGVGLGTAAGAGRTTDPDAGRPRRGCWRGSGGSEVL